MSKMRKSLAVLSSAIAPVLLAGSSVFAGVTSGTTPLTTEWAPTSTTGGSLEISSGTNAAGGGPEVTGGPGPITFDSQADAAGNLFGGDQYAQQVLGETFLTPATGFSLGAFQVIQGGGGNSAAPGTFSLHLFQLNSQYNTTTNNSQGGYYTLGNGGCEAAGTNDLLGNGSGVTVALPGANNAVSITEFDFTGTDRVSLLPNTEYALEMWNSGTTGPAYFATSKTDTYTNGAVTGRGSTSAATVTAMEQDHSTEYRSGGPVGPITNLLFAIYNSSIAGPPFWDQTTSGSWDSAASWSTSAVPNGIGAEADFLSAASTFNSQDGTKSGLSANGNVFTDTAKTVGYMNFDNATASYTLDGAGSLTMQTGSGTAQINVFTGTQEINLPLTIATSTVIAMSSGTVLNIADPVTINAGQSLTRTGTGTVNYLSTVTVLSGGSISFASPTQAVSLALSSSATAVVANHGSNPVNLLQLSTLTTDTGSQVDLTNNDLILHSGPLISVSIQLASVATALKNGFNNGNWNGTNGIASSAAASDANHLTTLGYMQSTGGTFDGVSTTTGDVLVKYTYYGDSNLDGTVNGADYQQIDMGYGMHLTGWQNGDFNYDGVVDGSDFSLIDNTYNQLNATGASPLALTGSAALDSLSPANVPEPATLAVMGFAALGLLGRRRRSV